MNLKQNNNCSSFVGLLSFLFPDSNFSEFYELLEPISVRGHFNFSIATPWMYHSKFIFVHLFVCSIPFVSMFLLFIFAHWIVLVATDSLLLTSLTSLLLLIFQTQIFSLLVPNNSKMKDSLLSKHFPN